MTLRAIFHVAAHHVAGLRQVPIGRSPSGSQMCDVVPDSAGESVMHITVSLGAVPV
jgi:hypothetical protein